MDEHRARSFFHFLVFPRGKQKSSGDTANVGVDVDGRNPIGIVENPLDIEFREAKSEGNLVSVSR